MTIFLGTQITNFVPVSANTTDITVAASAKSYYVATDGSDNNSGTLKKPFASLMKAQEVADSGDTVFIRGGVYKMSSIANTAAIGTVTYHYVNQFNKSGITYRGYGSEVPIFNFSDIPTDGRVAAFYVTPNAHDITFEQFEVIGIKVGNQKQSEGFRIEGKDINLNRVNVHDNQAVGIYYVTHGFYANLPAENNTNNSWNLTGGEMSDTDFQSLDMIQLSQPRGVDGALPNITFMKPTDSNKFKGLGHIY